MTYLSGDCPSVFLFRCGGRVMRAKNTNFPSILPALRRRRHCDRDHILFSHRPSPTPSLFLSLPFGRLSQPTLLPFCVGVRSAMIKLLFRKMESKIKLDRKWRSRTRSSIAVYTSPHPAGEEIRSFIKGQEVPLQFAPFPRSRCFYINSVPRRAATAAAVAAISLSSFSLAEIRSCVAEDGSDSLSLLSPSLCGRGRSPRRYY